MARRALPPLPPERRGLVATSAETGAALPEVAGDAPAREAREIREVGEVREGERALAAQLHYDDDRTALTAGERLSSVKFAGITSTRGEPLQSPVSGTPCVYWRLRVVEQMSAALQLVHEIASPDEFELTWSGTNARARGGGRRGGEIAEPQAVRMRVLPQSARIQATPVLHRPGSPGALAVGRQFGFLGQLSVEEVTLRAGDEIEAEGILEPLDRGADGPFRGVARQLELFDATVRLPTRVALGPVLLPWALGTAAALLSGVGVAAWAARRFDLLPSFRDGGAALNAHIGPLHYVRRHFSRPE